MAKKIKSIIWNGFKYNLGGISKAKQLSLLEYATISSVDDKLAALNPEGVWDESRITALESAVQALKAKVDNASSGGSGDIPIDAEFADKGVYKFTVWGNSEEMSVKINGITTITVQNGVEVDISEYAPIISCQNMFDDGNMTKIDVSKLDVSEVTTMSEMFRAGGNYKLTEIVGLTKMDTSYCVNMGNMFICFSGTELDCSNFDTRKVTAMEGMFALFRNHGVVIHADNFSCASSPDLNNIFSATRNYTIYTSQSFKDYLDEYESVHNGNIILAS